MKGLVIFRCKAGRSKRLDTVLIAWESILLYSTVLSDICCCRVLLLHATAILSCNALLGSRESWLNDSALIFQLFVLYY